MRPLSWALDELTERQSDMATKKTTKTAKKTTTKKATKKKPAKKATAKKAAAKKAPAKKAPAKKAATKKTTAKKAATKKAPAKKTTKATKKAPTKKTAAKTVKAAAKKTAKSTSDTAPKAETKPAPKPKAKKANVGQAPRKTVLAASIPVPTQLPPKEAPQADAAASENKEAAGSAKSAFKLHDKIVYPAHGVGQIIALEKQEVAGIAIELFVIDFDQEKMKLRVPTGKAQAAGMRPLSETKVINNSIELLKGRARIKRTMWSRRAQEYDAKINSGDIKLVAEVVRDLFRAEGQPEQSYSERQLFEAALDRMAREVAAVRKVDLGKAIEELEASLAKKTS